MNKTERVKAALNGEDVDRAPFSIWLHYPHKDQDPRSLADIQIDAARTFDFDFIKLTPFGLYPVQDWGCKIHIFGTPHQPAIVDDFGIHELKDWGRLEELPATYGTYGKQVQLVQHAGRRLGHELPFIQTIFSPMTVATKLAGDRVFQDMKTDPKLFHQALEVITATTVNFVKANIEAGVSGFFFATQSANPKLMSVEDFEEFGEHYDRQVLDAYKDDTFFNVVHIHGDDIMFEKVAAYPGNCINWHDRWVEPSLGKGRKLTDKCLLGGIHEKEVLSKAPPDEVQTHVAEAIDDAGRKKLMIGPGCVADPLTPEINYYAVKVAVERFSRIS